MATKQDDQKDEYAHMLELLKHYATLQFAELSVFIAIMGAALGFFFGNSPYQSSARVLILSGIAIVTACLWLIHESNSRQMWHFLKRAAQLEQRLGYEAYSKLPGGRATRLGYWLGPGSWSFRLLYLMSFIFWLATALGRVS